MNRARAIGREKKDLFWARKKVSKQAKVKSYLEEKGKEQIKQNSN
jgi:hypothetical protein